MSEQETDGKRVSKVGAREEEGEKLRRGSLYCRGAERGSAKPPDRRRQVRNQHHNKQTQLTAKSDHYVTAILGHF
jgi:hypothetical protein